MNISSWFFKLGKNKFSVIFILLSLGSIVGWSYYQQYPRLQINNSQKPVTIEVEEEAVNQFKSSEVKSLLGDLINSSYQGATFYFQATPIEDGSESKVEADKEGKVGQVDRIENENEAEVKMTKVVDNQITETQTSSSDQINLTQEQIDERIKERERLAQKQQERGSTGAIYSPPSPVVLATAEQVSTLKSRAPFTTDFFSLQFNYKTRKFEAFLTHKTNQSVSDFYAWLDASGYNLISHERFEFK